MFRKIGIFCLIVSFCVSIGVLMHESSNNAGLIKSVHAALARRPVEANQRRPRIIGFQMLDDNGTNNASISIGDTEVSIADAATGQYTVSFANAFYRNPVIMCQDSSTDGTLSLCEFGTKTTSTAILRCYEAAAPTTATNFDSLDCVANGWDAAEW